MEPTFPLLSSSVTAVDHGRQHREKHAVRLTVSFLQHPRPAPHSCHRKPPLLLEAGRNRCTMVVAREDYPPPSNPPRIASRQPSAQPSDKASRPRLVASIPTKSNRKKNVTIPPATYVKIRCGLPEVSPKPMNGPARSARMSKRQPHPRSLDPGRLGRRLARSRG